MGSGTYFSQPPPTAVQAKTCGLLFCTTCEKFLLTVQVSFDKWHLIVVLFHDLILSALNHMLSPLLMFLVFSDILHFFSYL